MKGERRLVTEDSLSVRPQPQSHQVLMVRRREMHQPVNAPKNTLNTAFSVVIAQQLIGVADFVCLSRREVPRLASGRLVKLSPLLDSSSAQN